MNTTTFGCTCFGGPFATCKFASLSPWALGVCAILHRAPREGLTACQLRRRLNIGDQERASFSSGVLQKLRMIGVIGHPTGATTRRYRLCRWPKIDPA